MQELVIMQQEPAAAIQTEARRTPLVFLTVVLHLLVLCTKLTPLCFIPILPLSAHVCP